MIESALLVLAAQLVSFREPAFLFRIEPAEVSRYRDPSSRAKSDGVPVELRLDEAGPARLDVFVQDRDRFPLWRWADGGVTHGGLVTLRSAAGSRVLLLVRAAGAPGYAMESPFLWPEAPSSRPVRAAPRRTLRGSGRVGAPPDLRLVGEGAGDDPLCESDGRRWQCVAVPARFDGRIVACEEGRVVAAAGTAPEFPDETVLARVRFAAALRIEASEPEDDPLSPSVRVLAPAVGDGLVLAPDKEWATSRLGGRLVWVEGRSDPNGRSLEVRAAGFATRRLFLSEVATACSEPVSVALTRAQTLAGTVFDGSRNPVAGAIVLVRSTDPARERIVFAETRTGEDGAFEVGELESRNYRVRACQGELGCGERTASPGETVAITLAGDGVFTGRVLSGAGVPVPGASVRIVPAIEAWSAAADRLLRLPLETTSGWDGRFRIAAPDTGDFLVEARSVEGGVARRPVRRSSVSPPVTDLGDLRLPEPIEFVARVAGCADGSISFSGPLAGETSLPTLARFSLDAGGAADVRLPEGGTWAAWAACAGSNDAVEPALLPDVAALAGIEVRFERAGRLEARTEGGR